MNFLKTSLCSLRMASVFGRDFVYGHQLIQTRMSSYQAIKLTNRRLIRLSGPDSVLYLQALITNDVRHLLPDEFLTPKNSLYAFILSSMGRVLCDIFVYKGKIKSEGEFILEVDVNMEKALRRLLWGYKVMRRITVEPASDFDLWALIPKPYCPQFILQEICSDDIQLIHDPRIPQMGYRLLSRIGGKKLSDIKKFVDADLHEGKLSDYQKYRYKLGVCEGQDDIHSAFYYPFDCNGDYLNAISINKGLYCSEEKTTKVYLKNPIRKRIMPIEFLCPKSVLARIEPPPRTQVLPLNSTKTGFLLNRIGTYGIAILPCDDALSSGKVVHTQTNLKAKTWKPEWWPVDVHQIYFPPILYPESLFNYEQIKIEESHNHDVR